MYNPTENNNVNHDQHTDFNKEAEKSPSSPVTNPGYSSPSYTSQTNTPSQSNEAPRYTAAPTGPAFQPQAPSYSTTPPAYRPAQQPGVPQSQARPAYTWNPQQAAPQSVPTYYPQQPKKQKKHGGKFAVKLLAAVLACAIVSLGSVGAFAALIQTGVINVESPNNANSTAAFTLYKVEENVSDSTPTVTGESLTPQEVAQKVIPSVVCVQNYKVSQQSSFFGGYSGYSTENSQSSDVSPAGEGSGIIISEDGYIVTNQHVIDSASSIKVVTSEGLTYEAELIGEDTQTDLAVIKITTDDELTPAEFGSSSDLQVADSVMAVGNPGGLQLNSSVTTGSISALNRQVTSSDTGFAISCIQTDAAINPGNSGGALVDMNGHVIGISSSKIVSTSYEGLGFAIPSDTVQPVVSDLIEFGYVKDRPMVGITGQYVDRMTATFFNLSQGYYVQSVTTSQAIASGLQMGDVITAIDDTQITSGSTIATYIAGKKPGDTVTLTVDRAASGQQGMKVELVLSENTGES